MVFPDIHIDGNWIDVSSAITGILYIVAQRVRRDDENKCRVLSKQTGLDFANGVALFPLLILACSALSSDLVKSLVEASKMSLSVAGMFSLLAILEDV
ncbi:hypothetical protein ACO0LB_10180 [Undibacterium sp. SXout7W]|uniref:hypothetical protein n=1 Tax=Undibacterium sp. SXout7W TaxID=3413049 RepID=UPI003BF10EB5